MAIYKFQGAVREDGVKRDGMSIPAAEGNRYWREFLEWEAEGNIADQFRNSEELVTSALAELKSTLSQKITAGGFENPGKAAKIIKALRKESKGTHDADDTKLLGDNDIVDSWYDQLEVDMKVGEIWVENPVRTDQELIDFDPAIDVVWTAPPVLI